MASNKVLITKSHLTNIGNAIREKTNTSGTILLTEMPDKIRSIKTGGTTTKPVIRSLSITSNGTYNAPTGVDGYSPITVNVPQTVADLHLEVEPMPSLFSYYRNGLGSNNNPFTKQQSLLDTLINNTRENIVFKPTKNRDCGYLLAYVSTDYNFNDSQILNLNYIGQDGIDLSGLYGYSPNITLPTVRILDNYIASTNSIFNGSKKEYIEDIFLDNSIRLANNIEGSNGRQFYNCQNLKEIDSNLLYKLFNKSVCVDDLTSWIYDEAFNGCIKLKNINNLGIYNAHSITARGLFGYGEDKGYAYSLNTFTFTNNTSAIWSGSYISLENVNNNIISENIETSIWSDYTITTNFEEFMNKVSSEDILYQIQVSGTKKYYLAGKQRYDIEAIKDTLYSLPDCAGSGEVNTLTMVENGLNGRQAANCVELQEAIAAAASKNWTIAWKIGNNYGDSQMIDYYTNHGYHFE